MSTTVIETLQNRVTIRDYTDQPIDEATLLELLRAARRSPTSSNWQTYSMVVVRDPETKKKLAALAGNQHHIEACPVFVALCADLTRLQCAREMHGESLGHGLDITLVATIDAALVGMSLSLAAESLGLGAVMIGSMRNDPAEAARLLGLPKGVFVVFGLCIGWPAQRPPQKPRLPEELVIHYEQYNADPEKTVVLLREYDQKLAEHYRSTGGELVADAWTVRTTRASAQPRREFLRRVLEELGFTLD